MEAAADRARALKYTAEVKGPTLFLFTEDMTAEGILQMADGPVEDIDAYLRAHCP